ncbi:MAG: RNA polymerase sigma factor [Actinomycetota bacterium]
MESGDDVCVPPGDQGDVVADALRVHRDDFESFVRSRVRPDEVDDLLQVAALRAIERSHTLDDPDRVVAWLYRIHRNLITDTHRFRARERQYVEPVGEPPEQPTSAAEDSCDCSVSQSKRLRPSYATILTLVDRDGLGLSEAARRLDVSTNNATVRLHRARKALRAAMLEHCGVADPDDCAVCRCVEDACCVA